MKQFLLCLAMLLAWLGVLLSACTSQNSPEPVGNSYTTTVSGITASVQASVSGCEATAYDKSTNTLTYTCTPPSCTGMCAGTSVAGVKQCSSTYNAQADAVDIFCGCKLSCQLPAQEVPAENISDGAAEPVMDMTEPMTDAGGTEPVADMSAEPMQDAGTDSMPIENAPEMSADMQTDAAPPQCAADEVLVAAIGHCVKKVFFDYMPQAGNEWLIHWSTSSTGQYFMWRGLVANTTMSCDETHGHAPADINMIQFRCKSGNTCMNVQNTRVATQSAIHDGKTFYYVKVITGAEEATMLHTATQTKRAWPYCQKLNATKYVLATTALGTGSDPWFVHMP